MIIYDKRSKILLLSSTLRKSYILSSGIAAAQEKDISKGGVILGHIKDTTLLESPIREVRVVVVSADVLEFETQTDADGAYELAGLPQVLTLSISTN